MHPVGCRRLTLTQIILSHLLVKPLHHHSKSTATPISSFILAQRTRKCIFYDPSEKGEKSGGGGGPELKEVVDSWTSTIQILPLEKFSLELGGGHGVTSSRGVKVANSNNLFQRCNFREAPRFIQTLPTSPSPP
ncbi:unnamed protein product [Linum trigynum]|uniref:Uncharacterized protein n=1 Tax=Linum trigynum TaxID=586398 RepID=A0AAV2D966_9ROSI